MRGRAVGDEFAGALENDLDIFLGHGFSQLPVYDVAAVAIQDRAEIVEGARDIDVGHINVPVLVRVRLAEKSLFLSECFWGLPGPAALHALRPDKWLRGSHRRHLRRSSWKVRRRYPSKGWLSWKSMIAWRSQLSIQWSRGILPLCSLALP